jgi:hypothetical protein
LVTRNIEGVTVKKLGIEKGPWSIELIEVVSRSELCKKKTSVESMRGK